MLNRQHLLGATAGAVTVAALGVGALTFAQTNTGGSATPTTPPKQGVVGTVTAVSGNTITLTGKNGQTYTVNAGSASITKDETVSVGDIKVGDTLLARGTVSGNSVAATNIHDGPFGGSRFHNPGMIWRRMGIRGTVEVVNGNTLTVSATNPQTSVTQTYTVNAANARVLVGNGQSKPTHGTLSNVHQGDTVLVAGPITGTTVTAKLVFDGPLPMSHWRTGAQSSTTNSSSTSSTTTQ